jgi:hypothetical protein
LKQLVVVGVVCLIDCVGACGLLVLLLVVCVLVVVGVG